MKIKNKTIFLLKDEPKRIRKAESIIERTIGAFRSLPHPLDVKRYFSFRLSDKLLRQLKLDKVSGNNIQSKKSGSLHTLISKCIRFDDPEDFYAFKKKNASPYPHKSTSIAYAKMPDIPKTDNRRYSYKKSRWSEMSKKQLIKEGNTIRGSKIRKPKESASKRKWINFLEMFSHKYDKNYQ